MQIEVIDTFLDLVETGSFTATADRLDVTQSTVSARVVALEGKLGHRLFRRGRAGTALTPEGERFEPHARAIKLAWVDAERAVNLPAQAAINLRLGFQPDLVGASFGAWVAAIRDVVPEAALYLEAVFSQPLAQGVLGGRLDLGVVFTQTVHPDLHFEALGEMPYVLVSSTAVSVSDIEPTTYIIPDYSPALMRQHDDAMSELALGRTTVGQSDLALEMMREMGGSSYQPRALLAELAKAGFHPVEDAPTLSQPVLGVVHLRNRHRKLHRQVLRAMARAL